VEDADGEARDWPQLMRSIRWAQNDFEQDNLVVVPTLDGLQYNESFLDLLGGDWPLYVLSGWRRPPRVYAKDTNDKYSGERLGWLLLDTHAGGAFREMVANIRRRNRSLSDSIRKGLQEAAARDVSLGAGRPGAHQFTADERLRGGRASACQRQKLANQPYAELVADICRWRAENWSYPRIAKRLHDRGARTPDGHSIGPKLVARIHRRAVACGRSSFA
jgi:hypothetical protein